MKIPSVTPTPPPATPEAAEPRGPDLKHDGDADDAAAAPAASPTPDKGQGTVIDTKI
jgi:hypothetical protein